MPEKFDVIVVGVGAMGSSACMHLARRGKRVLGLDRSDIPNALGSSHGFSRMIRLSYHEHPDYVPLLLRAYELWRELEHLSGRALLHITGGLYMGLPDGDTVAGALKAAQERSLPHELLTRAQLQTRYPVFHVPPDHVGFFEPSAGFLVPEAVIAAQAELALRAGAVLNAHEEVLDWHADSSGVKLTSRGPRGKREFHTDRIIFTAGAWTSRLLADLGVQLRVTRQVMAWVWPKKPELFELGELPVWALDHPGGGLHYGFPIDPDSAAPGFKLALHRRADEVDPDRVERTARPGDEETVREILRTTIPDADGDLLALRVCLYTNSPDSHFVIDRAPGHDGRALVACGFSGHGFKFASVMGEVLADLATAGATAHPIGFLGLKRFR
jgi:sarcosine oxidase